MSWTSVCLCVDGTYLVLHLRVGLLRGELHLFLELLQRRVSLLNLLLVALPGSVQLSLHLPLTHTDNST